MTSWVCRVWLCNTSPILFNNHLERKGSYYTTEYRCEEFVGIASTLLTWIHLKSMEKWLGLSELSVITRVSAVRGPTVQEKITDHDIRITNVVWWSDSDIEKSAWASYIQEDVHWEQSLVKLWGEIDYDTINVKGLGAAWIWDTWLIKVVSSGMW